MEEITMKTISPVVCRRHILLLVLAASLSFAGLSHADTSTVNLGDGVKGSGSLPVLLQFPVSRTGDTTYEAVLNVRTVDGTAHAGTDYVETVGTFAFPPGASAGSISVPLVANTSAEPDVSFQLHLDGAAGVGPQPSFGPQQEFLVGQFSATATAADLNGDGQSELIVVNYSNQTISVLVNQSVPGASALSFLEAQVFPAGNRQPVAVDLNGDGKIDVALGDSSNDGVHVLLNTTPTGSNAIAFNAAEFFATPIGSSPFSTCTADFNGDGLFDLATPNVTDSSVSVLLNNTDAGSMDADFAPQQRFSAGSAPSSIAAADLNGDGKPDLVVSSMGDDTLSVLINMTDAGSSSLTFAPQVVLAAGGGSRFVVGSDINRDGKVDLVAANSADGTVSVLLNNTDEGSDAAEFAPQQVFPVGNFTNWLSIADTNGDGSPDIFVGKFDIAPYSAKLLVNSTPPGSSTVSFSSLLPISGPSPGDRIASADLNNDGLEDLIAVDYMGGTVAVSLNTTAIDGTRAGFTVHQDFPAGDGTNSAEVADLNGDGRPDAIATNYFGGSVSVLINVTSPGAYDPEFVSMQSFSTGLNPTSVASADVNGDGLRDLLVSNHYEGTTSVLMNATTPGDGAASFSPQVAFASGAGPLGLVATDLNGDGRPDIAAASSAENAVAVLLNATLAGTAAPDFMTQQMFGAGTSPTGLVGADINGDGRADLIVSNTSDDELSVLLNSTVPGSSTASFLPRQAFDVAKPRSAVVSDINSDGRKDVIVINAEANTFSVMLNATEPGSLLPAFAAAQLFASGSGAVAVDVADADGDGKPDLFVSNRYDDQISVFLNSTEPGSFVVDFASAEPFAAGSSPEAVKASDLNLDGKPDILGTNFNGDSISVLLNTQFQVKVTGSPATGTIVHDYLYSDGFD
ncbi:FG-GAP-like repeat-containing protein [Dokdonella sp.]|uniref:FG-GAP-like repeat-containing protein n=1 Tax=Dokdonella sp. TaxID=2291710 RepID=UPI003526F89A